MDKPNTCIICGSSNIHDDGIEVDVDPDDYWHTARKNFRCQDCKALWQYNAVVQINFDYSEPQIESSGIRG